MNLPSKDETSKIPMNTFLEFLKLTLEVNEPFENINVNKLENYHELAKNELLNSILLEHNVNGGEKLLIKSSADTNENEKKDKVSETKKGTVKKWKEYVGESKSTNVNSTIYSLLDEVIGEGILDSILPFIYSSMIHAPSFGTSKYTSTNSIVQFKQINNNSNNNKQTDDYPIKKDVLINDLYKKSDFKSCGYGERYQRRKSVHPTAANTSSVGSEVIINVCDELKNVSRDFTCPQKLLISKMGYFADVTAGQRLEDMDISVHCDVQIFDWLMKWVKRDTLAQDMWPKLDAINVIPILVSAGFLQMEPLLLDCLSFCHSHLTDIVKVSLNLSCINDTIISRLSAMFTNQELELIKDKKERVTPRLWIKMIQSLCETEPQSLRGHYASVADFFHCGWCNKYLTQSVESSIHCLPQHIRLNRWGQMISQHIRNSTWTLTNYVGSLYKELRSWRKVYWCLWAHCHYLYCAVCETHFPLIEFNCCQYHPEQPQFLGPVSEGRLAGPAGRYSCCGEQAFRYEAISAPSGCQFREHTIQIDSDRDRGILKIFNLAKDGINLTELNSQQPQQHQRNNTYNNNLNTFSWNDIAVTPYRDRLGLLPILKYEDDSKKKNVRQNFTRYINESSSDTESSSNNNIFVKRLSTSSDGCESEFSSPRPIVRRCSRVTKRATKISGQHWSENISARSNQDNQREYEEKALREVSIMTGKKIGNEINVNYQKYYQGGVFIPLEATWRDSLKIKNFTSKGKPK